MCIEYLMNMSSNIWKQRNKKIHDSSNDNYIRKDMTKRIIKEHTNSKDWTHPDLNVHGSIQLGEILGSTINKMRIWLKTIQIAKEYVRKKRNGEKKNQRTLA